MPDIDVAGAKVFSKTLFSMVIPEVEQELEKETDRKSVVLFGIEVIRITFIHVLNHFCSCYKITNHISSHKTPLNKYLP